MSLLFNTLFRFVIAFLTRSNHLVISWLQSPSAVILEPKKRISVTTFGVPPSICHEVMGLDATIFIFSIFSFKLGLSLSFTLIKRFFSSSLLSAIRVVSCAYLRLLMFLLLIPACNSSSLPFLMMCSAYRLNKQDDSRQSCGTPFPNLNQSVFHTGSNCCFLTCIQVSQETGKMGILYSHICKSFTQFVMIHTVKGYSIVEIDVFWNSLAFSMVQQMFNLVSGYFAFSESILDIWKFLICIMLKPSMQDFGMTLLTWEMSATVQRLAHSLVLRFLEIGMKIDIFQSCGHYWVFQIC